MVRDDCKHYQPPSGWCDGDCCELRKDFFTPCENCEHYESKNKRTNAMKIRSMTDEELADWLGVYCNGQTAQEVGKPCVSGMGSCEECWLDWLKQEAKDV